MDRIPQSQYTTLVPEQKCNRGVFVRHVLPKVGEHGFKWVVADAIGKEYGHYGFRLHPKANPVNFHVFGNSDLIQRLAVSGKVAKYELELVLKKTVTGREFVLVNLYLVGQHVRETHKFTVVSAPKDHPDFVFTTEGMHGVGVKVQPL